MTNYTTFERINKPYRIQQVQGEVLVTHWGTVQLVTQSASGPRHILLSEILYIPTMTFNLLYLQKIINANYIPVFAEIKKKCIIKKSLPSKQEQIALLDMAGSLSSAIWLLDL